MINFNVFMSYDGGVLEMVTILNKIILGVTENGW